jgi:RHS repeat-associated protein
MKRLVALALVVLSAQAFASQTVYYMHTDALHSEVVVTDTQHQVIERTYYSPYGQVLNRSLRNGPGYAGHEEDAGTGLDYMQQRYYDPQTGTFVSPDPVDVGPSGGANFNRYAYANDNPIGRMNDPATAYYSREGGYVVRNDRTGDIVQVSDRNDPDWVAPWDH